MPNVLSACCAHKNLAKKVLWSLNFSEEEAAPTTLFYRSKATQLLPGRRRTCPLALGYGDPFLIQKEQVLAHQRGCWESGRTLQGL